jgi:hypothetical protein
MVRFEMDENQKYLETLYESRWYMFTLSVMNFSYLVFTDKLELTIFTASIFSGLLFYFSHFNIYVREKNISKIFILGYLIIPIVILNLYEIRGFILGVLNIFGGVLLVLSLIFIAKAFANTKFLGE